MVDVHAALRGADAGVDLLATRAGLPPACAPEPHERHAPASPASASPTARARARRAPFVVYLHGSGKDDRHQLEHIHAPADVFLMAPAARGTSNVYEAGHAQDIAEAIDDALANYPIDPKRIVLFGLLDGRLGVYRAFCEDAEAVPRAARCSPPTPCGQPMARPRPPRLPSTRKTAGPFPRRGRVHLSRRA